MNEEGASHATMGGLGGLGGSSLPLWSLLLVVALPFANTGTKIIQASSMFFKIFIAKKTKKYYQAYFCNKKYIKKLCIKYGPYSVHISG